MFSVSVTQHSLIQNTNLYSITSLSTMRFFCNTSASVLTTLKSLFHRQISLPALNVSSMTDSSRAIPLPVKTGCFSPFCFLFYSAISPQKTSVLSSCVSLRALSSKTCENSRAQVEPRHSWEVPIIQII